MNKTTKKTLVTVGGMLPLTAIALGGIAGGAMAESTNGLPVDAAQNGKAGIHLVKHATTPDNNVTAAPGTQLQDVKGATIAGVKFSVEKVSSINGTDISNLDYTKNVAWSTLGKLVDAKGQPKGEVTLAGNAAEVVTNEQGIADFNNLQFGIYKVTEVETPSGVTPADPFYVTLPYWGAQASNWSYNVYAYPKNNVDTATKTVNDTATYGVGDTITWEIETSVNKVAEGKGKYEVHDTLDKRVTFASATVASKSGNTTFTADTDYTVTSTPDAQSGKTHVKIAWTTAGLAKNKAMYEADPTDKVVTTINATLDDDLNTVTNNVRDTSVAANTIENRASFVPNNDPRWETGTDEDPNTPNVPPPGIPSNPVETRFGSIDIIKVATEDHDVKLQGAKFKIYKTEADAKSGENPISFFDATGAKVSETVTDAQGRASMNGLRLGNFYTNTVQSDDDVQKYWIVETAAPQGRTPIVHPVEIKLEASNAGQAGFVLETTVENTKDNLGFKMPLTGAAGLAMLGALVVGAAGGGTILHLRGRKKEEL